VLTQGGSKQNSSWGEKCSLLVMKALHKGERAVRPMGIGRMEGRMRAFWRDQSEASRRKERHRTGARLLSRRCVLRGDLTDCGVREYRRSSLKPAGGDRSPLPGFEGENTEIYNGEDHLNTPHG